MRNNQYVWTDHPIQPEKWLWMNGNEECVVYKIPNGKGLFLWVHCKQCGYAPSIAEAQSMVELAADIHPRLL